MEARNGSGGGSVKVYRVLSGEAHALFRAGRAHRPAEFGPRARFLEKGPATIWPTRVFALRAAAMALTRRVDAVGR
jgi:hypothetical protein